MLQCVVFFSDVHVWCCWILVLRSAFTDTVILPQACSNLKEGKYFFHAKEELKKYRIIVTTLFTAGR